MRWWGTCGEGVWGGEACPACGGTVGRDPGEFLQEGEYVVAQ